MDGPQSSDQNLTINVKELVIIKRFLEKGLRSNIFTDREKITINDLQVKFNNILEAVVKKNNNK